MLELDEPVSIHVYDGRWPQLFEDEAQRLSSALSIPPNHIEHIGSTAVLGLTAKPIIDIMLGLKSFPPSKALTEAVAILGYQNLGEAGVPGRLYFRRRMIPTCNLHLVAFEGGLWRSNLALRSYLRTDAQARERYAAAKRAAIAGGALSLLAYSEAKSVMMSELMREASSPARTKANLARKS